MRERQKFKTYWDLVGDGGSQILEQVQKSRRLLAETLDAFDRVVCVGSGKGGVGKSTITRLLALMLAERGERTAVLDADFNGPSQAILSGLKATPPIPGKLGLLVPRTSEGIGVLSLGTMLSNRQNLEFESAARGDSFTWRSTREFTLLLEVLTKTDWEGFQNLLIDLPPGTERTFQYAEFFGPKVAFLLVSSPSRLSRDVVARTVSSLKSSRVPLLGYIENMQDYLCADCGALKPLFRSGSSPDLEIPRLGSIPFDPGISQTGAGRVDLSPGTRPVLESICGTLLGALDERRK